MWTDKMVGKVDYLQRKIDLELDEWYRLERPKPLVLQGARQTGKSTTIRKLGESAPLFIELNLDRYEDLRFIKQISSADELLQALKLRENISILPEGTLLFIDEVQEYSEAMKWLRFLYEDHPEVAVVVAGSYLSVRLRQIGFSFPVGRVTFRNLGPLSFLEFALALGHDILVDSIHKSVNIHEPLPLAAHMKASDLLNIYVRTGGMPEAVVEYRRDMAANAASQVHRDLWQAFSEDLQKYPGDTRSIEAVFDHMVEFWGLPFKNERMVPDQTGKKTREALKTLDGTRLVHLVKPSSSVHQPLMARARTACKLIPLDLGMALSRIRFESRGRALEDLHHGRYAECLVGQQLLTSLDRLHYWVRQKRNSDAEVDFIIPTANGLLPIEVKSGATGRLRSLHQFMMRSEGSIAVRLHSGPPEQCNLEVDLPEGSLQYRLLSLPLYMAELLLSVMELSANE